MLRKRVAADGIVVTQATSPYFAPEAFWCIAHTLEDVFPGVLPYTSYVPSFGQWGFVLASNLPVVESPKHEFPANLQRQINNRLFSGKRLPFLRFLTPQIVPGLFVFDKDTEERPTEINTLDTQALVRYYEESLKNWE
jgi:spermidine synthase